MHFGTRFSQFVRAEFTPPNYLALPTAGIDISSSAIKIVLLAQKLKGLELSYYIEERIPPGSIEGGEISDKATVTRLLEDLSHKHGILRANLSLPESRGYLFEASVNGSTPQEWRTEAEQHLDEYVPLPPADVLFDVAPLAKEGDKTQVVGIGYAHRVVEDLAAITEAAGIEARAIETETFALPRALLPHGSDETVLIVDIGKTSTKIIIASKRLPRFATTLDIGGHSLTLAVQKYFGVTEEEAKRVKSERGLVPGTENEEYLAAMLSHVSVIRDEITKRIDYWNSRKTAIAAYEPISRVIIVGGNATVRGLTEYLESALKIPVELGDVFVNLASRSDWLPPIDFRESLAFGTAIGLALREYVP